MKYPKGINIKNSNNIPRSHKNRGMDLESDINRSNDYYVSRDIAYIYKKPTPIQVTKVEYGKHKKITEGFFKEKSTTDYNGLYKGYYIDFEAKETKLKSFPLNNLQTHQIEHLLNINRHKGISFIIVRFTNTYETFLLESKYLKEIIDKKKKRIPYEFFKENAHLIEVKLNPRLDYIKIIDEIIGDNYETK